MKEVKFHCDCWANDPKNGYLESSLAVSSPWRFIVDASISDQGLCEVEKLSFHPETQKQEYLIEQFSIEKINNTGSIENKSNTLPLLICISSDWKVLEISCLSNCRFLEFYRSEKSISEIDDHSLVYLGTSKGTAVELPLPNMQVFTHEYPVPNDGKEWKFLYMKCLSLKSGSSSIIAKFLHTRIAFNLFPAQTSSPPSSLSPAILSEKLKELEELKQTVLGLRQFPTEVVGGGVHSLPANLHVTPLIPSSGPAIGTIDDALRQMENQLLQKINASLDEKLAPVLKRLEAIEYRISLLKS